MKFNFNNLLQIIKHNKYIILGAFILLILILNTKPIIEGLTSNIGEYDYLVPIPSDNKISDDVFRQYVDKSNELNPSNPTDISTPDNFSSAKSQFEKFVTEPEAKYFIENGKFPVDGYVMNWAKNNTDKFPDGIDGAQKIYTNRIIYVQYIKPTEETMTPPPLAYNIFMGTAKPPPNFNYAATHPSSMPSSTPSSISSTTPSSSTNYDDFLSLCKKALSK